jgi:hypothetical protein
MAGSATCIRLVWRPLVSCLIAYALVLQTILVGIASASLSVADQGNDGAAGFELCLHNVDDVGTPDELPNGHSEDDPHCIYCILAALQFLGAPIPSLLTFAFVSSFKLHLPIADWRDAVSAEYRSQRPRGPPLAV